MYANLKLFSSTAEATVACKRSSIQERLEIFPYKLSFYLKRPQRLNKEPEFLCKDGRWRRCDLIEELQSV